MSNPSLAESSLGALIVDDERLVRKHLRQLLGAQPSVTILGEASSVGEAASLAKQLRPDVIFLDVQMPPESGFDLLPLLDPAPAIVFVTAHDEFAVRAFAASAADYLLKPVAPERLSLALQHVRHGRAASPVREPNIHPRLGPNDTLILRNTDRICRVRVGDIAALIGEGSYTRVHFTTERPMLLFRRMATWEELLPTPPFLRADRSLLINLNRITSLNIRSREIGELAIDSQGLSPLSLGRRALARIRAAMKENPQSFS